MVNLINIYFKLKHPPHTTLIFKLKRVIIDLAKPNLRLKNLLSKG